MRFGLVPEASFLYFALSSSWDDISDQLSIEPIMIGDLVKLAQLHSARSNPIENLLAVGKSNLAGIPRECRDLIGKDFYIGCFQLPFLNGRLEKRSRLAKFCFGYQERNSCLFFYGSEGLFLYVNAGSHWKIEKSTIRKVKFNRYDGSEIHLQVRSPERERVGLKFGEPSSAPKFVAFLNELLELKKKKR